MGRRPRCGWQRCGDGGEGRLVRVCLPAHASGTIRPMTALPPHAPPASTWLHTAIARIEADYQRSADTHLIPLRLPAFTAHGIELYLKDESTHPTGSLKHRLARSLFLYALCNGWIHEGSTVVESSSGSTAVSEAYFARLLGLPFVAVMPRST
ncbi:MAG: pyridoxal-phosphate dependent enzyme, partial [Acidovorax sp.]